MVDIGRLDAIQILLQRYWEKVDSLEKRIGDLENKVENMLYREDGNRGLMNDIWERQNRIDRRAKNLITSQIFYQLENMVIESNNCFREQIGRNYSKILDLEKRLAAEDEIDDIHLESLIEEERLKESDCQDHPKVAEEPIKVGDWFKDVAGCIYVLCEIPFDDKKYYSFINISNDYYHYGMVSGIDKFDRITLEHLKKIPKTI